MVGTADTRRRRLNDPTTGELSRSAPVVADGSTPGAASSSRRVATLAGNDWIEDIMLRTAWPDVYEQGVPRDPVADPAVVAEVSS